jgi:Glyoxalase-like domain
MPRRLDHLIICVRDLAQAGLDWRNLGFTLTPTGVHPFGTASHGLALEFVEQGTI